MISKAYKDLMMRDGKYDAHKIADLFLALCLPVSGLCMCLAFLHRAFEAPAVPPYVKFAVAMLILSTGTTGGMLILRWALRILPKRDAE